MMSNKERKCTKLWLIEFNWPNPIFFRFLGYGVKILTCFILVLWNLLMMIALNYYPETDMETGHYAFFIFVNQMLGNMNVRFPLRPNLVKHSPWMSLVSSKKKKIKFIFVFVTIEFFLTFIEWVKHKSRRKWDQNR